MESTPLFQLFSPYTFYRIEETLPMLDNAYKVGINALDGTLPTPSESYISSYVAHDPSESFCTIVPLRAPMCTTVHGRSSWKNNIVF